MLNKKLLLSLFILFLSGEIFSQKIKYKNLPQPVRMNFETMYPKTIAKKCIEDSKTNYEIQFKGKDKKMFVRYTHQGFWMCSGIYCTVDELSSDVKETLNLSYKKSKIISTSIVETNQYKKLFEVTFSKDGKEKTYWFLEGGPSIFQF